MIGLRDVAIGALMLALGLLAGAGIGLSVSEQSLGPAPTSGASTDLEPTASPSGPVPLPAPLPARLRCVNGDPPTTWTRIDAEAAYHAAAMHLRTAEAAGLWNDRGQRALRLATTQLLEILVCASPGGPP